MTAFKVGDKVWLFEYVGYLESCISLNLEDLYLCHAEITEIKPWMNGIFQCILTDLDGGPEILASTDNLFYTKKDAISALLERFNNE